MNLLENFLEYVKIDTTSNPHSDTVPSTMKQFDLARLLEKQMKELGLEDVRLSDECYLYGKLPSNLPEGIKSPTIGLIAHMDTSPDVSGKDVKPQIIKNYDGSIIPLGDTCLSCEEFPVLNNYIGKTLITTDGSTLLGADDKAGIAVIMSAVAYLIEHPEIKHGDVMVGFTPDEEIGRGADYFDVKGFGADFAYTVDGGQLGELECETFNAASAKIKVIGKSVHPGSAKDIMINSQLIAAEIISSFPRYETPEKTEGYEGFYMLSETFGGIEESTLIYIIRDHDKVKFEERKTFVQSLVDFYQAKYGKDRIILELKDSYYNMKTILDEHEYTMDRAKKAYTKNGVEPIITPVRGGTDGARLSFMGLPTPNMFTGGHNFHGRQEFVVLESMEKARDILIDIVTVE